jgi:hypothetical protein
MVSIHRLAVASAWLLELLALTLASGCSGGLRTPAGLTARSVLAQAGDRIGTARYVDAIIEYRERRDDQEAVVPLVMLFGPGKRIRVERAGDFAFYDGSRIGRLDSQTGELGTMDAPGRYVSPIMFAGTIMGGVTLPVAAARELGRNWWEHMYGADAHLQLRDPEVKDGRRCYVLAVQPRGGEPPVVWWIERDSLAFVGFRVEGGKLNRAPTGIVQGDYKLMRFPSVIGDERFRAPTPSEEILRASRSPAS